jgi:predicted oxidoreductase
MKRKKEGYRREPMETYDREGLKTLAEILISGGEIPYTYGGKEYKLQIICGVPEWLDTKAGQIASCKTQNEIYTKHDTNQDEFWKFFEGTKRAVNKTESLYKKSLENEYVRRSELAAFIRSEYPVKDIKNLDAAKIFGRIAKKDKSLLKKYGKDPLKTIESDIISIRKTYFKKREAKA